MWMCECMNKYTFKQLKRRLKILNYVHSYYNRIKLLKLYSIFMIL